MATRFTVLILLLVSVVATSCDRRPTLDRRLVESIQTGDGRYLRDFLKSGGDVNRMIQYDALQPGKAPLIDTAIQSGNTNAADILLAAGADPNALDARGNSPLIWAVSTSRPGTSYGLRLGMVKLLLKKGANPNGRSFSEYGWSPLMFAAELEEPEMIQMLLASGADVHARSTIGQTALHLAAKAECARLLLNAGADPSARTIYGEKPIDYATTNHRPDVVEVLMNNAASKTTK